MNAAPGTHSDKAPISMQMRSAFGSKTAEVIESEHEDNDGIPPIGVHACDATQYLFSTARVRNRDVTVWRSPQYGIGRNLGWCSRPGDACIAFPASAFAGCAATLIRVLAAKPDAVGSAVLFQLRPA